MEGWEEGEGGREPKWTVDEACQGGRRERGGRKRNVHRTGGKAVYME